MSRSWPSWLSVLALAAAVSFVAIREERQSARVHAVAGAMGWEYQTASVELGTLATKLTEFGRDGWEVFSIVSTDSTVDPAGADGKPHFIILRIEVTAKRPKMP